MRSLGQFKQKFLLSVFNQFHFVKSLSQTFLQIITSPCLHEMFSTVQTYWQASSVKDCQFSSEIAGKLTWGNDIHIKKYHKKFMWVA